MHISSIVAPTEAQAQRYSAWRSRATTWVAGTGVRPSAAHTMASTAGSMFEYVPTAPESLPTATASRAARRRRRSRSAWSAHSANLAPKVVGSACIPWVRPVTGTCISSRARALSTVTNASRSARSRSAALVSVAHSAVSTTSDEVSP